MCWRRCHVQPTAAAARRLPIAPGAGNLATDDLIYMLTGWVSKRVSLAVSDASAHRNEKIIVFRPAMPRLTKRTGRSKSEI
jgi:hypothetical protein